MKRAPLFLVLAAGPLAAQPAAVPVPEGERPLVADPGEAFYQRIKDLHDLAAKTNDPQGRMEKFQAAASLADKYLREFPNHPNAPKVWFYLGNSYYMGGSPEKGKAAFLTLLNRYGNTHFAAVGAYILANDHYSRKEYAFAAPLYERYGKNTEVLADRPRGNFYAAECYRLLGRDREALNCYKKVLDDPAGGNLIQNSKQATAEILLKGGKAKEALALYEEVISVPGNTPKLRGDSAFGASVAAQKLGDATLAEKYLKFLMVEPGMDQFRPDAQTALMENAFIAKQYDQVIDIYRRNAIRAEGDKEAARLMIAARAYMELKRPTEAQALFREVEKLVPPENDLAFRAAYYRLHCFYQIEGRHVPEQVDGFLQIYRKLRPPDDPRIHTALFLKAENLFQEKKIDEAAEAFREINVNSLSEENRPGLLYDRGWCLAEKDDFQGAIRSFSEFISRYPKDDRRLSALAQRAKCYASSGESAKALADFNVLTADGVPQDLASFAWLESARMMRDAENNMPEMVARYKGLLTKITNLSKELQAEANFCIGLGLVKQNNPTESISYLEKARSIDHSTYSKRVGLLLAFAYHTLQDAQKLSAEINLAIEGKYIADISEQTVQWAGMQAYGGGDYKSAARFLSQIANPDDPRSTSKDIWRYLGKARLETGDGAGALIAAENFLAVEEDPALKADGLVDKGRALYLLQRFEEARKAAKEAGEFRLQEGRTKNQLDLLSGDLFVKEGNLERAIGDYSRPALFGSDVELTPLALHKLADAWDKKGDKAEADKARQKLAASFPNWKPAPPAP